MFVCVSDSNKTVFQTKHFVQPTRPSLNKTEVLNTSRVFCFSVQSEGTNAGLTALFLDFRLILLHKKVAVVQSVAVDCCTWPSEPGGGFQTQPHPQRGPLPTEGPLCLAWDV